MSEGYFQPAKGAVPRTGTGTGYPARDGGAERLVLASKRLLEAVAERLRHLLLVLDDEDAHIKRV